MSAPCCSTRCRVTGIQIECAMHSFASIAAPHLSKSSSSSILPAITAWCVYSLEARTMFRAFCSRSTNATTAGSQSEASSRMSSRLTSPRETFRDSRYSTVLRFPPPTIIAPSREGRCGVFVSMSPRRSMISTISKCPSKSRSNIHGPARS